MSGLIVFIVLNAAGVLFMLYVLVNFHFDMQRSKNQGTRRRHARFHRTSKTHDPVPTAVYAPAPEYAPLLRSSVGAQPAGSRTIPGIALR